MTTHPTTRAGSSVPASLAFSLQALEMVFEAIEAVRPVVRVPSERDAHLADPLKRASTRTALGLGEGHRKRADNRRLAFERALGEADDARVALRTALAWGPVEPAAVEPAADLLLRVTKILTRLT